MPALQDELMGGRFIGAEEVLVRRGAVKASGKTPAARTKATLKLMAQGTEIIAGARLAAGGFEAEPDILEKRTDVASKFGAWRYLPVSLRNQDRLNDQHKLKLCLESEVLKLVQGVACGQAFLDDGEGLRIGFDPEEYRQRFEEAVDEIRRSLAGELLPPRVSSGCRQSPWLGECVRLAEKDDDVALLYGVKDKLRAALRRQGLGRYPDLAAASADHFLAEESDFSPRTIERTILQARSLAEKRHFVRRPVKFPDASLEVFFDIESDPLRRCDYLFGFLVRERDGERYRRILAEKPEDERELWREFLEWAKGLPPGTAVYHYGDYEPARLDALERRYGGSPALDFFREGLIDLNDTVKECLVFPLYFYGLKDIGGFLGFSRQGIASGADSVGYYEAWLTRRDRKKLDAVIAYNEADVRETAFLKDWLEKNGKMIE